MMKKPSLPVLASAALVVSTLSGCPVGDVAGPVPVPTNDDQPVGTPAPDTENTDDQSRLRPLPLPSTATWKA